MPFLFVGLVILIVAGLFLRRSIKSGDKEGAVGMIALLLAGLILTIIFGLFYRGVTLLQ